MPHYNFPTNLTPPDPPDACELAIFPVAVVPYALAALESRATPSTWSSDGYVRGQQLVRSLQLALLCGGLREITDRQDALYRLHATALYGTNYEVIETEPELIVTPAIESTHAIVIEDDESIFGRMELQKQLLENGINGTSTTNYNRENGIRDLLEQLKAAIEADNDIDADMLAKLVQILGALA